MFDSEAGKGYKSMWKHRKLQSKMDMLRRLISLGVILQLIANIGKLKNIEKLFSYSSYMETHINVFKLIQTFMRNFQVFQ